MGITRREFLIRSAGAAAPYAITSAARAGKDVCCGKPLSLTIAEGRALAETFTRYGRVFQHGTERTGPVTVEGTGSAPPNALGTINRWHVEFTFADGVRLIFTSSNESPVGARFEGTEGWVFTRGRTTAHPRSILGEPIGPNEVHLYRSGNHGSNFLECIGTRKPTVAPAEVGHRSTALCHLAYIAVVTGRKRRWDARGERFVNDDGANRLLSRAMRPPWRL